MSPISLAIVRPSGSPTPGIVTSSRTRGSARASGRSSRSSGISRWSSTSTTATASATERRHTSGIRRSVSSCSASGSRKRLKASATPNWLSTPWARFMAAVRSRTRCIRRPSRSLSSRSTPDVTVFMTFLVADTALHRGVDPEHVADRLAQRLGAVDHAEHALLDVEATLDEVGQQCGGDGRVPGRAVPQPQRVLDASLSIPSATTQQRPLSSTPSSISTAKRRSPSGRLISAIRFSRVRETNSRDTADLLVDRSTSSIVVADRLAGARIAARRHAGEHPLEHDVAERVALGEVTVRRQLDLTRAVDGRGPAAARPARGAHRESPHPLMAVAHRPTARIMLALRAHDLIDLGLHEFVQHPQADAYAQRQQPLLRMLALRAHDLIDLGLHEFVQHPQADAYAQRQQPLLRGAGQLAQRPPHPLRQPDARQLVAGDLIARYRPHRHGSSCPRWTCSHSPRSQRERTRRENRRPQVPRATGQPLANSTLSDAASRSGVRCWQRSRSAGCASARRSRCAGGKDVSRLGPTSAIAWELIATRAPSEEWPAAKRVLRPGLTSASRRRRHKGLRSGADFTPKPRGDPNVRRRVLAPAVQCARIAARPRAPGPRRRQRQPPAARAAERTT